MRDGKSGRERERERKWRVLYTLGKERYVISVLWFQSIGNIRQN